MFSFRNGFYFQISCSGFNFVSDFSAWGGILPGRGRGAWSRVQIVGFCPRGLSHCSSRVQNAGFCPRRFSHSSSRCSSHSFSRVRIVDICPRRLIQVCKSGLFAPVVLLIERHGCRLRVLAPVGFNECCPELRQGPAQLRVLRNSPRAMPLFGLPIIVMTALYTSRKQVKLQRACV